MTTLRRLTFRFVIFNLTILFLLLISPLASRAIDVDSDSEEDGLEFIDQLIAVDEDQEHDDGGVQQTKSPEAEVWSKAQRVVIELNADTANRIIDLNEFVLVLGYAPWCDRSAETMPQFAEAAMALKGLGSSVVMAKIDAERYPKAASFLGIKGFPTLLLFVNATSNAYTGGYAWQEMVIWVRKKTGFPVIRINSLSHADSFVKRFSTFAIGLFENFEGPVYREFLDAATLNNEIQFAEVSDVEIANVLYPEFKRDGPFMGLVKSEPERFTSYLGTFKTDSILEFLDHHKLPLVNILTEANSARVYSSSIKLQVFVFAEVEEFEKLLKPLQDIARKFLSKIMFVLVDIGQDNLAKPLLTLFGLEELDDVTVVAFNEGFSSKYLLEGQPATSRIEEFCSKLYDGTLQPYFKSQAIPVNEGNILIVVGKTFDELVLNNAKNLVLEVHTPWCIDCDSTSKQVEKLAKHFKGLNSLVFARIDASANEHPKLKVDHFPTLLFYPAADKINPIHLSTRSGLKELAASINKYVKAQSKARKDEL
uniref:Thioredoxin domain-containing protein n=1 Tax=Kalanchoe fedtschenkoi TaxID=63787 RepID=A0A7N0REQ1_KALFE